MFETLEPPDQIVARRWPLLTYGTYGLAGLALAVLSVRRHGFLQPVSVAIACVMFFLSLVWFVTTLRSASPLTNRKYGVRSIVLLLLLMAHQFLSI
jgi:hypothetical protein